VREGVTISHRGSVYEIGRGLGFYGIWVAAAPKSPPVEWWPETPDGWYQAWSRFTYIEAPGAITEVGQPAARADPAGADRPDRRSLRLTAAILLAIGVAFGIAGLFPDYLGGASLAAQPPQVVPHAIYLAAWTAGAALLLPGGSWARIGALVAAGTSVVTFGLYFSDLGNVIAFGTRAGGAGLVLTMIGWLACAAGSVLGFLARRDGILRRPRGREAVLVTGLAGVAGLGAALAFAPAWDSYTLWTSQGLLGSTTEGNAFANPGPVIFGDVAVMVVLVAVVIIAALWRPVWQGAALLAGATVPLAAQVISALVGVTETASPQELGISGARAAALGLTAIDSGLTAAFWVFCAFVAALILLTARMVTAPALAQAAPTGPAQVDTPPASLTLS
jgi:hypothetical protein